MINFCVLSPDEEIFWNSWIAAGICSAPREFTEEYQDHIQISDQTSQGWAPVKDDNVVPGWHANVRVGGVLEQQFTYGLSQTDENGNLLPLFDRTWAAEIFQLTPTEIDPVTGFKSGYQNASGVRYADASEWATPANVWA